MKDLKSAMVMLIIFTVICGCIYPAVVTGFARVLFPDQARGSFITDGRGRDAGSRLIGQPFSDPRYFWPRPSATAGFPYNPVGSGGSNAGPTTPEYLKGVGDRVKSYRESGVTGPIPAELVQASASGLDPHLSPEAVLLQVPRVARARNLSEEMVTKAVAHATEVRQLGFLGEPRVNVLELNLELDGRLKR